MNIPTMYYVLYIITVPDILIDGHNVHRLSFEHQKDCLHLAEALDQIRDPIVRKQQCQELTEYSMYLRPPMPKPKGMP